MAWSDAARAAAAETRRRHAKTRGARVSYVDRSLGQSANSKTKVFGKHAFSLKAGRGTHTVITPPMKFSAAKARVTSMARRISARIGKGVMVNRMP